MELPAVRAKHRSADAGMVGRAPPSAAGPWPACWRPCKMLMSVGQTIVFCRLSTSRPFVRDDRPRKAMVCPTYFTGKVTEPTAFVFWSRTMMRTCRTASLVGWSCAKGRPSFITILY